MAEKILVIEDEIIIAEGIKLYLLALGYEVDVASNGKTALDYLHAVNFDAVICDINLNEDRNGIDLIKLHYQNQSHRTPVIFLTAYSNSEIMDAAEEVLPYAYIIKPFNNRQLLTTLKLSIKNTQKGAVPALNKVAKELIEQLSVREKEILKQLATGKTSKDIGNELFISCHTVDTHIRNIKEKLGLNKKGELIKFVFSHDLG